MSYSIFHDLFINASPEIVFDAISQPVHLDNWWTFKSKGNVQLDSEYNFHFTPGYDWYGKVITCNHNSSFHIKMTKADTDWTPTSFGFDLEGINNGTQLSFWHKNWPKCNHHFKRSSFCWAMLLNGLKNYTESNIIIPFEKRE